jgi:hypothetical protein
VKSPTDLMTISYFPFGNRGSGEMSAWLARGIESPD